MAGLDSLGLDPGVYRYVDILWSHGVETFESCEGGEGHSFPDPTVRFHASDIAEAFRVLSVALDEGLPVFELRRVWVMQDGEPHGPHWEITFLEKG